MRNKENKKISIIFDVAIFFLIAVILTGILTYTFETRQADVNVTKQTELDASEIAEDVSRTMTEYPACSWLIQYWYTHSDTMDIEYDALPNGKTKTAAKCRDFTQRHPDLQLKYLDEEQCRALSAEDQKLYAEIIYSWLLTSVDEIKQSYHVDYMFCVISEEPFDQQFFLYTAAQPGAVRGTEKDEAYVLGTTVTVSESQAEGMREALRNTSTLSDAGNFVDYYQFVDSFDGHGVFIGLTYDLADIRGIIAEQTRTETKLAILLQLILALICLLLIGLFLLRPLKKIQRSIRSYSETKDSAAVCEELEKIRVRNELGQLSDDVADLAKEIDAHTNRIMKITSEKERIETELSLANEIQTSMLPNVFPPYPNREEFDLHACMYPARDVGGDFYDFFLVDDDHLCMVIADVSGKGIPAALFMMASKIILSHHAKAGKTPAQILTDANESICNNNTVRMFVTVWLGILEISTGKLTAANAGHESPVLKHPDGGFELLKDKHGLVIGGIQGMKYSEYELQLEPGAKLFVYTDGVPEATNAAEEFFGKERMLAALNEAADEPPVGLLQHIHRSVDGFVKDAEQFDDLTMLCLAYRGK